LMAFCQNILPRAVVSEAARGSAPAAQSSARESLPDDGGIVAPPHTDGNRRESGHPATVIREKSVNTMGPSACAEQLKQYHNCTATIRTDLARQGAAIAAGIAAEYAVTQDSRYHTAQILLGQAVRDLSAAYADFWRAGSLQERRRCLVWIRRCDAAERYHRAARNRAWAAYVRADRAAQEAVA
jgi:hypothetical protein